MKKRYFIAALAISALAVGSARAADISNGGSSAVPAAYSIAQHTYTAGATARIPVERANWSDTYQVHSVSGQSFLASKTAVAGSISVFLDTSEDFTGYNANSIELKVFEGDHLTRNTNALATFVYDPTVLGDDVNDIWLEFGLDAGISMTEGNTYSFLFCFNSESKAHSFSFRRAKDSASYADGDELRGANSYDIFNWDTDPWDDVEFIGSSVSNSHPSADGDLFFSVNEFIVGNVPPLADDITMSTLQNTAVDITLSGYDINGDPLTFAVQDQPTNGTLTGTAPDLTYTPDVGYVGPDRFTYTAFDGTTNSEPASVNLTVHGSFGLMTDVGRTDPAVENPDLIGTAEAGALREVIRTDSQTFAIGQSFTLAEDETVSEIYLQNVLAKDFSNFSGGVEIKVFSGEGATATHLHTSIFDVDFNNQTGVDIGDDSWVRFSLQDGGVDLPAGANSFLVFWTQKASGNKWGFSRNKTDGYAGGVQYEYPVQAGDAYPQWETDPWASVTAIPANDLTFYINSGASSLTPTDIYVAWAAQKGANADMTVDTDSDGMDDLLEYALGGIPTIPDADTIQPASDTVGDWLYYVYNRREDAADRGLTYEVFSSLDLVYGPITNATEYVNASSPVDGFESVTNRIPTATEGKQFIQLKVELGE